MNFLTNPILVPSLILLSGMINDLKSRKVKNEVVLICAGLAILSSFIIGGLSAFYSGLMAAALALGICLPLVISKFFGAGDMKLFVAFALATNASAVLGSLLYSILWAGILSLIYIIFKGQFKEVLKNIYEIISFKAKATSNFHTIPYTVALFLGWLTYVTMSKFSFGAQPW